MSFSSGLRFCQVASFNLRQWYQFSPFVHLFLVRPSTNSAFISEKFSPGKRTLAVTYFAVRNPAFHRWNKALPLWNTFTKTNSFTIMFLCQRVTVPRIVNWFLKLKAHINELSILNILLYYVFRDPLLIYFITFFTVKHLLIDWIGQPAGAKCK
jgi:hypothetical protein